MYSALEFNTSHSTLHHHLILNHCTTTPLSLLHHCTPPPLFRGSATVQPLATTSTTTNPPHPLFATSQPAPPLPNHCLCLLRPKTDQRPAWFRVWLIIAACNCYSIDSVESKGCSTGLSLGVSRLQQPFHKHSNIRSCSVSRLQQLCLKYYNIIIYGAVVY